ncbi:MAG: arsenic transporter, partial [Oscillibacter sp.]|nr:arsenic transporter [Oscillibacter sp.]
PAAVPAAVDWNVLMMLAGTMGTVDLFIRSNMPTRLSDRLVSALPNVKWLIVVLALFAGLVSAFVDNVATVLMLAPVGIAIAKRLEISPVAPVLAIAVSSNLQGAATLVGDTTSILLAGHMALDFADFFFYRGRPGMFWVVEVGALATVPVMMWLFRKEKGTIQSSRLTPVEDHLPTVLLVGTVLALIVASFFPNKHPLTNGFICMAFFLAGLAAECVISHRAPSRSMRETLETLQAIDYETLLLLAGLFIVIDGVERVGIVRDISAFFSRLGGGSVFRTYTIIVWASVLLSAFIDNIPYTAAMLPVVGGVASAMGADQAVLCFGLLVGATLGGNLTPVGASANIAAAGILRREGYEVTPRQFMRIGVPFTLAAVLTGYVLVWVFYA